MYTILADTPKNNCYNIDNIIDNNSNNNLINDDMNRNLEDDLYEISSKREILNEMPTKVNLKNDFMCRNYDSFKSYNNDIRNNDKNFDSIMEGPRINTIFTKGLNNESIVDYEDIVRYNNIDNRRPENNKQKSYTFEPILNRNTNTKNNTLNITSHNKNKPDLTKMNNREDVLANTGYQNKHKLRENIKITKYINHKCYNGHAKHNNNKNINKNIKIRNQKFINHKCHSGNTNFNTNKNTNQSLDFNLRNTLKDKLLCSMNINIHNYIDKNYSKNITNELRTTLKQQLLQNLTGTINSIVKSTPKFNYNDLKNTLKENLVTNIVNNINSTNKLGSSVNINNEVRETLKQNTLLNICNNIDSIFSKSYGHNPNNIMKKTIKETMLNNNMDQNLKGNDSMYANNPNNVIRRTIKETMVNNNMDQNLKGNLKSYIYNINNIPATTLKQILFDYLNHAIQSGVLNKSSAYNINNIPPKTLKEIFINYISGVRIQKGDYKLNNPTLRNTLKSLLYLSYQSNLGGYNKPTGNNKKSYCLGTSKNDIEKNMELILKLCSYKFPKNTNINNLGKVNLKKNTVHANILNHPFSKNKTTHNIDNIGKFNIKQQDSKTILNRLNMYTDDQLCSNPYVNNLMNKYNPYLSEEKVPISN